MPGRKTDLNHAALRRVLLLDGAMGTILGHVSNRRVLTETSIHRAYLRAGADIITTNSFMLNAIDLSFPLNSPKVAALNEAAAKRARILADRMTMRNPDQPRFVAGSVGPTSAKVVVGRDRKAKRRSVSHDDLMSAFAMQMAGLIKGRVDAVLIETAYAELNLGGALVADRSVTKGIRKPPLLWVSAVPPRGRTVSPAGFAREFWKLVKPYNPWCVGFNCVPPGRRLLRFVEALANVADCRISIHPSAGKPNQRGEYPIKPDQFAQRLRPFLRSDSVSIVGGCCGTTRNHIAKLRGLL